MTKTLNEIVAQIRESLAVAFSGYSQYGTQELAAALRGHVNQGLLQGYSVAQAAEIAKVAADQEVERWEEMSQADHDKIVAAVIAAIKTLNK